MEYDYESVYLEGQSEIDNCLKLNISLGCVLQKSFSISVSKEYLENNYGILGEWEKVAIVGILIDEEHSKIMREESPSVRNSLALNFDYETEVIPKVIDKVYFGTVNRKVIRDALLELRTLE